MTKRLHYFIFLISCLLFAHGVNAQNRENYSLLWEVVHPETGAKSYIFGTMHLHNAKVFQFSDAFLPAFKSVDAFALEIHPDSAIAGSLRGGDINSYLQRYQEVLGDQGYNEFKTLLVDRYKIYLDSMEYSSPSMLQSMIVPNERKPGEPVEVLDQYLFSLASNAQKDIYGLEEFEGRELTAEEYSDEELQELLEELMLIEDGAMEKEIQRMVDLYYQGDIQKIFEEVYANDQFEDSLIVRRNQVMADRFALLTQGQTLFAAVGAAHLPGKSGVLELLRKKKFKVRKAEATFEKPNMELLKEYGLAQWSVKRYEELGYEVKIPGALQYEITFEAGDTEMTTDPTNAISVFHYALPIPNHNSIGNDTLLATLSKRIIEEDRSKKYRINPLEKSSKNYTSLVDVDSTLHSRLDFYCEHNQIYVFGASYDPLIANQQVLDEYFKNIKIFKPKEKKQEVEELHSENGAFIVEFPLPYQNKTVTRSLELDGLEHSLIFHQYYNVDRSTNSMSMLLHADKPMGYYIEDQDLAVEEVIQSWAQKNTTVLSQDRIDWNGYVAYDFLVKSALNIEMLVRVIYRGNRNYILLYKDAGVKSNTNTSNSFFNSFKFKDYLAPEYKHHQMDHFTVDLPGPFRTETDTTEMNHAIFLETKSYMGHEKFSGDSFGISVTAMGDYFHTKDIAQFLKDTIEEMEGSEVRIENLRDFQHGNIQGMEYLIRYPKSTVVKTSRVFFAENYLINQFKHADAQSFDDGRFDRFWDSFQSNSDQKPDFNVSTSEELLTDLTSEDPATYQKAHDALEYYLFDKKDGRRLMEMIKSDFPNDSLYYGTTNMLILSLAELKDDQYLNELKSFYLENASDYNQAMIMQSLPYFESSRMNDLYFDLAMTKLPESIDEMDFPFLEVEHDSLFDLNHYGDRILEIQKNKLELRPYTLAYLTRRANDSIFGRKFLMQKLEALQEQFAQDVAIFLDEQNNVSLDGYVDSHLNLYMEMFDALDVKSPFLKSNAKKIFLDPHEKTYDHFQAFNYYLDQGGEYDTDAIRSFMKPLMYRFEAMEALVERKLYHLTPRSYYQPREMGRLSMFNALYDYDYNSGQLHEFLGEIKIDGAEYLAYQYHFDGESENKYLAVVEVAEVDPKNPEQFQVMLSGKIIGDMDWKPMAKSYINELLSQSTE
ncbi:TraB/GumN family protein [Nonlabens xiamenensis]|uniref:TraB/GumN family protein n=1 Tax=Nonlabens xiamenensis TaxID=2341043 RepID=UPI0013DD9EA5|nr:TraB/GumN family protein [Nonlabens xiamenensis]